MTRYMIIHCKHEGCYDFQMIEDAETKTRLTSIRINPPLVFLFDNKESACEFFSDYINNVDSIDNRCKKGDDVEHIDYCTCGIIELDEEGENPVLFYNKKNQIFFLENGAQVFSPPQEIKTDMVNFNITNKLLRKYKSLTSEQKEKYIELGKLCQECTRDKKEKEPFVEEEEGEQKESELEQKEVKSEGEGEQKEVKSEGEGEQKKVKSEGKEKKKVLKKEKVQGEGEEKKKVLKKEKGEGEEKKKVLKKEKKEKVQGESEEKKE
jgi:hypothetical protein